MMKKRLLMVGGWSDLYRAIKALGFDLTVLQNKEDIATDDVRLIDQLVTTIRGADEVVTIARSLHAIRPFDAVVSFQEQGVLNAAKIGAELGLLANPLGPVALTRNKGLMREHMAKGDFPSIPFGVVASGEEIRAFGAKVGYPIIVKPIEGLGSHHIKKLYSGDGANQALSEIRIDYPGVNPIAEKFVSGPEVSVEAISWNGVHEILAVTDKLHTGEPYFVEVGHTIPSRLPKETIDRIHEMTRLFLTSIGHQHGPTHTEIIVGESGPVIIESHTRAGGDRIFELVELTSGINMFEHMLRGLLGKSNETERQVSAGGAAIRYMHFSPGRVEEIVGLEDARQCDGVIRLDLKVKNGDMLRPVTQSIERHGYVLAVGKDAEEAAARADAAVKKVRVVHTTESDVLGAETANAAEVSVAN
ncbi:ATP-grasp domain-containing protein [Burkholderia sp. AU30280]|uniref:ATP-grasp domain-containing protein n=1 Tax=Burkholderia sp. AU30280 TaxID=2879628 RepID=UPI001CF42E39|nr:ATP-grasp domain-containing protein [Burkholderia sp. AU30280]MCA8276385.1 ATP-grasp domain-containing protein [Burkholderia sp. AU30280]